MPNRRGGPPHRKDTCAVSHLPKMAPNRVPDGLKTHVSFPLVLFSVEKNVLGQAVDRTVSAFHQTNLITEGVKYVGETNEHINQQCKASNHVTHHALEILLQCVRLLCTLSFSFPSLSGAVGKSQRLPRLGPSHSHCCGLANVDRIFCSCRILMLI